MLELERITARRNELDTLAEELAKQSAEVQAEREELVIAERVLHRLAEQDRAVAEANRPPPRRRPVGGTGGSAHRRAVAREGPPKVWTWSCQSATVPARLRSAPEGAEMPIRPMTRRTRTLLSALPVGAAVCQLALAWPAQAASLWTGDASGGTSVFGLLNCDAPGTITTVNDAQRGTIWKYSKPSGSNRCESHGIKVDGAKYTFQNGKTYWFGWSSKLSSTVDNNANFQWKSYGDHIQNWPVVLKMIGGRATVIQRQPDGNVYTIWSAPVSAGQWNRYAIGLHLSDATKGGWVELYFNGRHQTFSDGTTRWACRTFDSSNDPKWGTYGAEGSSVVNYIDDLKAGTTYGDVD